jgi:hypothetical protein
MANLNVCINKKWRKGKEEKIRKEAEEKQINMQTDKQINKKTRGISVSHSNE